MSDAQLKIIEDTIRRLKEREEPIKKPSPKWENVYIALGFATVAGVNAPPGTLIGTSKVGLFFPSKDIAETKAFDPIIIEPGARDKAWKYKGAFPIKE